MAKRVKRQEGFSVYQRNGSRFWYIQYTDPKTGEQVQYSSKTTDKALALERASTEYTQAWKQKNLNGAVSWTTKEIIEWHLKRHLRLKEKFNEKDYWPLIKAPLAAFGHITASELKVDAIRQYVALRQASEMANGTINRELAPFRAAFRMAMKTDGMLPQSPFTNIPVLDETARSRSASAKEEALLIEGTTGTIHDIVEFDFDSGLRAGQIRDLKWTDVDMDELKMRVTSFKGSKGKKFVYWVPIYSRAMLVLRRRPRISEFVFCNVDGSQIGENGLISNFPRITERLKIQDFNFHDIRHTFGTNHYRRFRDIIAIMNILGHTSPDTTKRYLNLTNLDLLQNDGRFMTVASGNSKNPLQIIQ